MPYDNKRVPVLEKIKLDGFDLDLNYFLGGDFADISVVAEELPAVIEWVNQQHQTMVESRVVQEQVIKQCEARAYFALRQGGWEETYSGRCTADALKHAVQLDAEVIKAYEQYAVLDGWVRRLYNLQESLNAKLQLIRSSEATRRKVFSTEME